METHARQKSIVVLSWISPDLEVGDRCTVGGIVQCQSLSSVRLSSAHVLLPSRGLHTADKGSHSAKQQAIHYSHLCLPGPETDL